MHQIPSRMHDTVGHTKGMIYVSTCACNCKGICITSMHMHKYGSSLIYWYPTHTHTYYTYVHMHRRIEMCTLEKKVLMLLKGQGVGAQ